MTIRPRYLLLPLLLSLCGAPIHAQQAPTSLQQRMTPAEFSQTGLDKLTPQELKNLDRWLNTHDTNTSKKVVTKVIDSSGKPVFYPHGKKRQRIDTRIVGHLDGWSRHSEFIMANGQHWESIDPNPHSCRPMDNPEVKIKPSLFGTWLMYVPSCYTNVHVKRLN